MEKTHYRIIFIKGTALTFPLRKGFAKGWRNKLESRRWDMGKKAFRVFFFLTSFSVLLVWTSSRFVFTILFFFSLAIIFLSLFLRSPPPPLPMARWPVRMKEWIHYSPLHSPPNWDKMDWKAQRLCMNESLSFGVVHVLHFSYLIEGGGSTVSPFHLHP